MLLFIYVITYLTKITHDKRLRAFVLIQGKEGDYYAQQKKADNSHHRRVSIRIDYIRYSRVDKYEFQ
jgi:hypothetical protein